MIVHEFSNSLPIDDPIDASIRILISLNEIGLRARNITAQAKAGSIKRVISRDNEMSILKRRFLSWHKPSTILIGDSGVGKTTLVEGLASDLLTSTDPFFQNLIIIEIYVGSLIADTTYRGQMEKKLISLIDILTSNPEIVLFIDEAHTLFMTGDVKGGGIDIPNLLKQTLSNDRAKFILATTDKECSHFFKDEAFKRRFRFLKLNPLPLKLKKNVLEYHAHLLVSHTNITIDAQLIDLLSNQYLKPHNGLDVCIDILDETFSMCLLEKSETITASSLKSVLNEYKKYNFGGI